MKMYNREPVEVRDGVPVFSRSDAYISNYDKISEDHLAHLKKFGENPFMSEDYWQKLEDTTLKHVAQYLKEGDKVLDVGVGLGRMLEKVTNKVDKYGVDISLSYLKEAKAKGIDVCLAKIEEMPFIDEHFDVIICTDVLEHVFDFFGSVNQILRVLKKDGTLILRVPYREDLSSYVDYHQYDFVHLRNFDEDLIKLQFNKIFNCEVIDLEAHGLILDEGRRKQKFIKSGSLASRLADLLLAYDVHRLQSSDRNEYYALLRRNGLLNLDSRANRAFLMIMYKVLSILNREKAQRPEYYYQFSEITAVIKKRK